MRYGHSWESTVNISYVILDSLVFNSKIITTTYPESLIKTQSQDRQSIYLGNPQGEENPTKLPLYKMYKI